MLARKRKALSATSRWRVRKNSMEFFIVFVMKQLDPIEELYDLYLEEEDFPRIVELDNTDLDFGLENGLADLDLAL